MKILMGFLIISPRRDTGYTVWLTYMCSSIRKDEEGMRQYIGELPSSRKREALEGALTATSTLFVGARAWKKGSNRAACIMNVLTPSTLCRITPIGDVRRGARRLSLADAGPEQWGRMTAPLPSTSKHGCRSGSGKSSNNRLRLRPPLLENRFFRLNVSTGD